MDRALEECDLVITTGGVSVGDYDFTPAAMDMAGVQTLIRTLYLKPGGASAYGIRGGKILCGLSGNPASALTNFYAVVLPALRKLRGLREPRLTELTVTLAEDFPKKSPKTRLIRGKLDLSDGTARMHVSRAQGNGVLHSLSGCDLLAEIPAGTGKLPAGTALSAYLIP
jgi:molybdopterin molybdotransferase